jgi:hypothetical protein
MHCTMDDLVALKEGEASVWARNHLETCAACRAELEGLYQRVAQLKALPALRPARDRWPAVQAAVLAARAQRRRVWSMGGLAAAAAVAGILLLHPWGTDLEAQLVQAKRQSATYQSALREYGAEGRVMSGREAVLAAALEDRIAAIDGRLAQPGRAPDSELVNLWQQRADLMQQLVQVRVTRAAYVGL